LKLGPNQAPSYLRKGLPAPWFILAEGGITVARFLGGGLVFWGDSHGLREGEGPRPASFPRAFYKEEGKKDVEEQSTGSSNLSSTRQLDWPPNEEKNRKDETVGEVSGIINGEGREGVEVCRYWKRSWEFFSLKSGQSKCDGRMQ